MEWLQIVFEKLQAHLSAPYLFTFMLLAYLVRRYFSDLLKRITKFEWRGVYTVLILATVVAIPYAIWADISWDKLLLTYAFGTSLHELIFKWIEDKCKKK